MTTSDIINLCLTISTSLMTVSAFITLAFTIKDRQYRKKEFQKHILRDQIQYWIKKSEFKLKNAREYESRIQELNWQKENSPRDFSTASSINEFHQKFDAKISENKRLRDSEMRKYNSYIKKINAYFEENEEE